MPHFRKLRSFLFGETGAVTIFFVILIPTILIIGGVATDFTLLNSQKRHLQRQVDLAAMAGAQHVPNATSAHHVAQAIFAQNGRCVKAISAAPTATACTGEVMTKALPYVQQAGAWKQASRPQDATALFVEGEARFKPIFLGSILSDETLTLRRTAIAQRRPELTPMVTYTLRNRLLRVNTGQSILNGLLEPLGVAVTADILGTSGLASARVKLEDLLGLVSSDVGVEALTFDDVLNARVTLRELLGVLLYDKNAPAGSQTLLSGVSWGGPGMGGAVGTGLNRTVTMGEILKAPSGLLHMRVKDVLPNLSLGVLDVLGVAAQLARAENQRLGLGIDVKLISDKIMALTTSLGLIRTHTTGVFPPGPALPAQLTLSQLDLAVEARLLTLLYLNLGLGVAGAEASLTTLNCQAAPNSDEVLAAFSVRTTPLNVRLRLNLFFEEKDIKTGNVGESGASVPLLTDTAVQVVSFTRKEYDMGVRSKTYQSNVRISNVVGSLMDVLDGVQIGAKEKEKACGLLNILGCLFDGLKQAVRMITAPATETLLRTLNIDLVINRLLDQLGIGVASAEITIEDIHCDMIGFNGAKLAY